MDFTHLAHLQHGYVDPEGRLTSNFIPGGIFLVRVGKLDQRPASPLEEAVRSAELIRESTKEEIWLCLSGGVDSEAMARAFLKAKVPFKAAIMRFNDGLNWFDIHYAVEFCEYFSIPYRFFDLNIPEFYLNGRHFEIAHAYRCTSPQLTTHLHLLEMIPGYPVLSWNLTTPYLTNDDRVTYAMPKDLYFCYERFLSKNEKQGAPFFFLHTPGIFYSLLRQPLVQDFLHDRGDARRRRGIDYPTKCEIYRQGGFAVQNREDKFTGFEEVKKYFQNHFQGPPTSFDDHFRVPLKKLYPDPSKLVFEVCPTSLLA